MYEKVKNGRTPWLLWGVVVLQTVAILGLGVDRMSSGGMQSEAEIWEALERAQAQRTAMIEESGEVLSMLEDLYSAHMELEEVVSRRLSRSN